MTEQPEALRLADELNASNSNGKMCDEAADELRRLHQHELANELWHKKTEWVQNSYTTAELGLHRADVIKQRIDRLHSLNQELVEALEGLDEAYCRAGSPLNKQERHEDRMRLIVARRVIAKHKEQA